MSPPAPGSPARWPSLRAGLGVVALSVAVLTLTSRVVGFARWVVFSKTVGDTCLGDVYNAANALPNVVFEIVAGGVLAGVVVPVVARHVGAGRSAETSRTVSALLTWTLLVLTPPALAAFFAAEAYARAFSGPSCAGAGTTLAALLVMFVPQIWFYGLAVVTAGVLQAHSRFLAAALAPLLSSVVVIGAYAAYATLAAPSADADLTRLSRQASAALGVGTTLGVLVLATTTTIAATRLGLRLRPRLRFAPGDRAVVVSIALAGVAGLVLQQLATLAIALAAQRLGDPGALTRFVWANAIYLLPYAVLVAPLLQLVFPRLSTAAERGSGAVSLVLDRFGPPVALLACLAATLLAATAVPVARVFVLGPGSGRTAALAGPISALAPAVVGFALLGLATRILLASHRARAAGGATVVAWGVVVVGVTLVALLAGTSRGAGGGALVTALAAAVSAGMLSGALVGWWLVNRAAVTDAPPADAPLADSPPADSPPADSLLADSPRAGRAPARVLVRPLRVGLPVAVIVGGLVRWATTGLGDASLLGAAAGALAAALAAAALFLAAVFLLDRSQLQALRALRADPAGG